MKELSQTQKEIMKILSEKNISNEDIISVMLVLTNPEKSKIFLEKIKLNNEISPDEVFELAGNIAFGEEKN